jgi:TonB family protein
MTDSQKRKKPTRPPAGVFVGVLVAVLGVGIWWLSQNIAGVTRGEPPVPTVNLLPPPPPAPPPPPPPPEKPPEPDKNIEPPKPSDQPKADESKQLTMAGPAQAGGDSFGIKAGSGGGMSLGGSPTGGPAAADDGGFAEASYSRYAGSAIQRAVLADDRLSHLSFSAEVAVWIDATGHPARVAVRRSTGDQKLDQQLVATLERMGSIGERPPSRPTGSVFMVRTNIRGSRG